MKFLPFILKHLRRTWVRTASTVAAMALCVFLFCVLQSFLVQINRIIEGRSPRRLIARHAVSIVFVLPRSYAARIEAVPGVKRVAITNMFAGLLPARKEGKADAGSGSATDWTSAFQNLAVDAEPYFTMNPELIVPPEQFRAFMGDLRGCVIGRQLADKFGWRIGDRFFLESIAAGYRKSSGPFEFVVRAIADSDLVKYPSTDTNIMYFHFKYLDESFGGKLPAQMFTVEIDDPQRAGEISAAIDALFENSSHQTYTETEKAFAAGFLFIAGDLTSLLNGIGLSVCFTILLVSANTMSMAVRERRTEVAVLKTLGFTSAQVMGLIVAEALALGGLGGALGIAGAQASLWMFSRMHGITVFGLPSVELRPSVALLGLGVALLLGFAAGFMPAWSAYRAKVTDVLRDV